MKKDDDNDDGSKCCRWSGRLFHDGVEGIMQNWQLLIEEDEEECAFVDDDTAADDVLHRAVIDNNEHCRVMEFLLRTPIIDGITLDECTVCLGWEIISSNSGSKIFTTSRPTGGRNKEVLCRNWWKTSKAPSPRRMEMTNWQYSGQEKGQTIYRLSGDMTINNI